MCILSCIIYLLFFLLSVSDTLMVVLQFEWGKLRKTTKNHFKVALQNAASKLISSNLHAYHLCLRSLRIVKRPWKYPIITKITNGTPIEESEGIIYRVSEIYLFCLAWADLSITLLKICLFIFRARFLFNRDASIDERSPRCNMLWWQV